MNVWYNVTNDFVCIKGADHSAVDLSGCTPLHLACGHEDPRVAKLLLDEGNFHIHIM